MLPLAFVGMLLGATVLSAQQQVPIDREKFRETRWWPISAVQYFRLDLDTHTIGYRSDSTYRVWVQETLLDPVLVEVPFRRRLIQLAVACTRGQVQILRTVSSFLQDPEPQDRRFPHATWAAPTPDSSADLALRGVCRLIPDILAVKPVAHDSDSLAPDTVPSYFWPPRQRGRRVPAP